MTILFSVMIGFCFTIIYFDDNLKDIKCLFDIFVSNEMLICNENAPVIDNYGPFGPGVAGALRCFI